MYNCCTVRKLNLLNIPETTTVSYIILLIYATLDNWSNISSIILLIIPKRPTVLVHSVSSILRNSLFIQYTRTTKVSCLTESCKIVLYIYCMYKFSNFRAYTLDNFTVYRTVSSRIWN